MSSCTHRHPLARRPRAAASWVQTLGNSREGSTHSTFRKSVHAWFLSRVPSNSEEEEEDRLRNPPLLSAVLSVLREESRRRRVQAAPSWEGPGCPCSISQFSPVLLLFVLASPAPQRLQGPLFMMAVHGLLHASSPALS